MKVGDLVKWSEASECWDLAHSLGASYLTSVRKCGIIVDKNSRYFFVFWENNELLAQEPSDLKVISES